VLISFLKSNFDYLAGIPASAAASEGILTAKQSNHKSSQVRGRV